MSEGRGAAGRTRVLYLYNAPEWAIHNVGRDWAAVLSDTHDFTLMQFGGHEREDPSAFDHVVWGYSTLGYSGRMLLASLGARPRGWLKWNAGGPNRLSAVVQDPSELFPEVPDWKRAKARVDHLGRFHRLAATSNEMVEVLAQLGRDAVKVNTRSLLPLREREGVARQGLRVLTRAREYPRKNLALFRALQGRFAGVVERFDAAVGDAVLPRADYVRLLDGYNCYMCTSWQEGGPLPLMDALRRGCVALTTRVGQTDELVEEGGNGFFCDDQDTFALRIRQLHEDPALLERMRLRALELAGARDDAKLRVQLRAFLP